MGSVLSALNEISEILCTGKRYIIHPTETISLKERKETKSLRTQYQVINETERKRNNKVIKDEYGQLQVKPYTKTKNKIIEKLQIDFESPSCKQRNWIEFDE